MMRAAVSEQEQRLWIVRHGESTWNAQGRVQGQKPGSVLTATGREQARTVGMTLSTREIATVLSSDLSRAEETASIIALEAGTSVSIDRRLRERSFGVFEGRPWQELRSAGVGVLDGHVQDLTSRPDGGESMIEVLRRATAAIVAAVSEVAKGDIVVVTHGGVVRVLDGWINGEELSSMPWRTVANCEILSYLLNSIPTTPYEQTAVLDANRPR